MTIKPNYEKIDGCEFYPADIMWEYKQCIDEGLDIEKYKELFEAISRLPHDEIADDLGDTIFKIISNAPIKDGYEFNEPSGLEEIKALRKPYPIKGKVNRDALRDKVHGAWLGRICGCMLGKTVEGIRSDEFIPFLKETDNYPLSRYIYRSDLMDDIEDKYKFGFTGNMSYVGDIDGMPADDDTNYTVLAQIIREKYGKNFTPYNVSVAWMDYQPKYAYCTAERIAFCNFVKGFTPPESAAYKNPYREWIGAQIRGDYWGYINPGNPELAAEMAWRDASISHVKNGIYGEMLVAAMLANAAVTSSIEDIILSGLAQIPSTSRLYRSIGEILKKYRDGVKREEVFDYIHSCYDEHTGYGWCHTIPNAMIVTASLLYGEGNYAKSICIAVQMCFDTDCNGATVGSILGMANGIGSIPEYWTKPINNILHTSVFGVGAVKITDMVDKTMLHIQ